MNATEVTVTTSVRDIAQGIDPAADIILYGSHARGDAKPDSDWDILIITSRILLWDEEQKLRSLIYRYEVLSDTVLSIVIHSAEQWTDPMFQVTPFYKNVLREGIRI